MNRSRLVLSAAASIAILPSLFGISSTQAGDPERPMFVRTIVGGVGGWDYLTMDSQRHRLFITRGDRVQVLDIDKMNVLGEISGTRGVHGVALAQDRGVGLSSNGASNSVTIFGLESLRPTEQVTGVGSGPDAIVYEKRSGRAFTLNGKSHDATAIDVGAARAIATITLPGRPEFGVSNDEGSVFVNIEDRNSIVRIDAATLKITAEWALAGCDGPTGLAIDTSHRRLFSSCGNRVLIVVNESTGAIVAKLDIGAGSDAVAFDAKRSLVLSSNREGTISVIHEEGPDHFTISPPIATLVGARTLALDEATHRAFVVTSDFEATPTSASGPARGRPIPVPGTFSVLSIDLSAYPVQSVR
jgi:hypothetical protein